MRREIHDSRGNFSTEKNKFDLTTEDGFGLSGAYLISWGKVRQKFNEYRELNTA
jgi:hypothetical protein